MAFSVRTRFEAFKRDNFTCQYCGRKSPEVVLEADHIVAKANGGSDDIINIRTSCWECNSGKSDKPLNEIVTGEDPHDRAILMMERERQLREYNAVLAGIANRIDCDIHDIEKHYLSYMSGARYLRMADVNWLRKALTMHPAESIKSAIDIAYARHKLGGLQYVAGILRNSRQQEHV